MTFPADLPHLLRLACAQGQMRLNVWFGSRDAGRGYQVNLANSGQGWTVVYDPDALEGITEALRKCFGARLERMRAEAPAEFADDTISPEEVEQAVGDALLSFGHFHDNEIARMAAAVRDKLFPADRPPVHEDEPAAPQSGQIDIEEAIAAATADDDDFEALL